MSSGISVRMDPDQRQEAAEPARQAWHAVTAGSLDSPSGLAAAPGAVSPERGRGLRPAAKPDNRSPLEVLLRELIADAPRLRLLPRGKPANGQGPEITARNCRR